jgi:hypothetical protein
MAGTLTISTLSDGTNSTSATNPIMGSAKAWVNFDGSGTSGAQTIRASYNVSSVTYVTTGVNTISFTNAFVDTNYAMVSATNGFSSTDSGSQVLVISTSSENGPATLQSTSQITVITGRVAGVKTNSSYNFAAFFR